MYRSFTLALLLSLAAFQLHAVALDTTVGIKAPKEETKNYTRLTHYLCDPLGSEEQKVFAIYNWITHNIAYDAKSLQKGSLKQETAEKVLKRKKGVCEGYARLFVTMCREAGIPAVKVDGYAKDWNFDDGDKLYIPRHCWNAVLLNNKWQLVDVTWGAGGLSQKPGWLRSQLNKTTKNKIHSSSKLKFSFHYDPQYCLQPADSFRIKHLPADPLWQLANEPMPIEVFEGGQSAIAAFNAQHPPAILSNPYLKQLAGYTEEEIVYESADRATEFNNRFYLAKAAQYELGALYDMTVVAADSNRDYTNLLYKKVKEDYKQSEGLIKEQKKGISAEYKTLKRKNKVKSTEAARYVMALRNDNKRLIAQCKGRIRMADGKYRTIGTRFVTDQKKRNELQEGKLGAIKTVPQQKEATTPELQLLLAGIEARNSRIGTLGDSLTAMAQMLADLKATNKQRLETLAGYLEVADSALVQETIERIHMRDNYDEEVKAWTAIVKKQKYELGDTLHRQYLGGYDAVLAAYETQKKWQKERIDLQKSNLRDLEQYRRWNNTNTAIVQQYHNEAMACQQGYDAYLAALQQYAGYIKGNKGLFGTMIKIYERQDKITEHMEKAEKHRKEAEEKYFAKKEAFDQKENTHQLAAIERNTAKADREYARMISGKKKKSSRKV